MYSSIEIMNFLMFPFSGSFSPKIPFPKYDLPAPVFPSNIILGTFFDPEDKSGTLEKLEFEHGPKFFGFPHLLFSKKEFTFFEIKR